jgi:hypothetical protein
MKEPLLQGNLLFFLLMETLVLLTVGDMAIAEMMQMVKVVIDGNRLFMEHAQEMLEHGS